MNKSNYFRLTWGYKLLIFVFVSCIAFLLIDTAYADHCKQNPFNAADCMRSKGFRQTITITLVALGTGPVLVNNALNTLGGNGADQEAAKKMIEDFINRFTPLTSQTTTKTTKTTTPTGAPKIGVVPKPPVITPAPRWKGPFKDEIIGPEKNVDKLLEDLSVLDDIQNLDPDDLDRQAKLDDILKKANAKDPNRRIKAINFDWKTDNKGNILRDKNGKPVMDDIVVPQLPQNHR